MHRRAILRSNVNRNPDGDTALPPNDMCVNTRWSNTLSRRRPAHCSLCHNGRHSPLACPTINPVAGIPAGFPSPNPCTCHLITKSVTMEPGRIRQTVLRHQLCHLHCPDEQPVNMDDLPLPTDSMIDSLLNNNYNNTDPSTTTVLPDDLQNVNLLDLDTPPTDTTNDAANLIPLRASTPTRTPAPDPVSGSTPSDPLPTPSDPPSPVPDHTPARQPSSFGPTRRRKPKTSDDTDIDKIVSLYKRLVDRVASGQTLRDALLSEGQSYGTTSRAHRHLAELYLVDRVEFDKIFDAKKKVREMGAACKTVLTNIPAKVVAAKTSGLILKK